MAAVRATGLGTPRVHHALTDSTNERARELAAAGAPHGTLVTAASQESGRGRQGRTWSAPAGSSLLCSLVLRDPHPLLPLATGVATADALGALGFEPMLKWPNDVLLEGRKVAGILAEGRPAEGWAVVGVGVNVALRLEDLPDEVRPIAATLGLGAEGIERVLGLLLEAMDERLAQTEGNLLDAFRQRDGLAGREVSWSGGVGVAAGIDGTGRLIVEADGIRHLVDAGEIHIGSG